MGVLRAGAGSNPSSWCNHDVPGARGELMAGAHPDPRPPSPPAKVPSELLPGDFGEALERIRERQASCTSPRLGDFCAQISVTACWGRPPLPRQILHRHLPGVIRKEAWP